MKRFFISLILVLFTFQVYPHSGKARFHVIIDTDGGFDDLRAVSMMLSFKEFEVLAITTSDGICDAGETAKKVQSLLNHFYHEGIPVGQGQSKGIRLEENQCMNLAKTLTWGDTLKKMYSFRTAAEIIFEACSYEHEPVIFIALGPLTNILRAFHSYPELMGKITAIAWYNDDYPPAGGMNYQIDVNSAKEVFTLGIPMIVVRNPENLIKIDDTYIHALEKVDSPYSNNISRILKNPDVHQALMKSKPYAWDDLVPVCVSDSSLFRIATDTVYEYISYVTGFDENQVRKSIMQMLSPPEISTQVFSVIPHDPVLYKDDVGEIMKEVIEKYGAEEWRACVITNELHGHLGIYAIIGAKMGIRAREYFDVGLDDIEITSFAGMTPPVSCMNDGLQVSTGGTLGHGLIIVKDEYPAKPQATFSFRGQSVTFSLRRPIADMIRNDIKRAIDEHGNLTPDYWEAVRKLAIVYWNEFDRHSIFQFNTP